MTNYVLKDLIDVSKDGEWGEGEPFDDSVKMLAIRGTDFDDVRLGMLDGVPRRHIAGRIARRKSLQPWDLLIEVAGGTKGKITGRTLLLRPQLFEHSELPVTCASFSRFIRLRTDLCDPEFVFWYLQYLYDAGYLDAYHTQHTGVSRFQWTTFAEREPLLMPPLATQRKIARVLSAYDGLIENNQRRIRILEEMARALYREWFVERRFPGRMTVQNVRSRLGDIPMGWKVQKLGEILELHYGKALKQEDRRPGGVPVYGSSGVVGSHNTALVSGPGIIVGRKGNVGSVFWSDRDFYPIDTVYFVVSKVPLRFLFHDLQRKTFLNSDAAVPGLNRAQAYSIDTLLPPQDLLGRFSEIADAFGKQASLLRAHSEKLRLMRELLLPCLVTSSNVASRLKDHLGQ